RRQGRIRSFREINLVQWNCTNLTHASRIQQLRQLGSESPINIVMLQEARLENFVLQGFHIEASKSGLALCAIKEDIEYHRLEELENQIQADNVAIRTWTQSGEITFINIYVNPSTSTPIDLAASLQVICGIENFFVVGDFNAVGITCFSSSRSISP